LYGYVGNAPVNRMDPLVFFDVNASDFSGPGDRNRNGYGPLTRENDMAGPWGDPDKPGASLPATLPADKRKIKITNPANGRSVICPVVDKGPWNTRDNYWDTKSRPLAESQHADKKGSK